MAPRKTRKREHAEAFEAAFADVSDGAGSKTFVLAISSMLAPGTHPRNPYAPRVEEVLFSEDESDEDNWEEEEDDDDNCEDEDNWEEDDMLPEESPEVIDPPPPATSGGEYSSDYVVGRAMEMSTDEDEYVDIEGTSDTEEYSYDGEVVD